MAAKSRVHKLHKVAKKFTKSFRKSDGLKRLAFFVLFFAVVASVILIATHAASPNAKVEPESGTVRSPATSFNDSSASNGKGVQFNRASALNGERLGISTGTPYLADGLTDNSYMAKIAQKGMKWVRLDAILSKTTSYADSGIQAAKANNLNVLIVFTYGGTSTSADRTASANKMGDYIAHWNSKGYLGTIKAYEIWNEPNNKGDSSIGYVVPSNLADILKKAYPIIKSSEPLDPIITGGLAPGGGNTSCCTGDTWNPADYLDAVYKANGNSSNGMFDAVAVHPYDTSTSSTSYPKYGWRNTNWMRDIMDKYGDQNKKIWNTESGWSSCAAHGSGGNYTEAQRETRFKADMKDWFYGIHNSDGSTKKDSSGNYIYDANGSDWNTGPFMIFKLYKTALDSSANSLGLIYTPTQKCDGQASWYEPPIVGDITLFSASKQSEVQPSW